MEAIKFFVQNICHCKLQVVINLYTFFFLYFVIQLPVGIEKLTFITLSIRFDTTELGQQETKARIKFLFRPQTYLHTRYNTKL
jgi:hypothetical protein